MQRGNLTVAADCLAAHRRGLHDDEEEGPFAATGALFEAQFMFRVSSFLEPK